MQNVRAMVAGSAADRKRSGERGPSRAVEGIWPDRGPLNRRQELAC